MKYKRIVSLVEERSSAKNEKEQAIGMTVKVTDSRFTVEETALYSLLLQLLKNSYDNRNFLTVFWILNLV
jgi:hypothetical protein